jgi:DNA repair protein RadC
VGQQARALAIIHHHPKGQPGSSSTQAAQV